MDDSKGFVCDEKYQNIIAELESRGWVKLEDGPHVPPNCSLIWKNLSKINFGLTLGRYVNHIRGIHHLSNKSYLAYHLDGSGSAYIQPPTWSSSYHDISVLIGWLMLDRLVQVARSICSGTGVYSDKDTLRTELSIGENVCEVLCRQGEWRHVGAASQYKTLLSILRNYNSRVSEDSATSQCEEFLEKLDLHQEWRSWGGDRGLWIIKPVAQACGRDIQVLRGIREILQAVETMGFKCVVQKYIEHPLLLRNAQKFDIRQWVLVTSLNPLVVYGFSECYLRLSSKPFSLEDSSLNVPLVHLCNQSIQLSGEIERECVNASCPTMMSQAEFCGALSDLGKGATFEDIILPQIKHITIDAVSSCREEMNRTSRGFEWLGLDLMVTENLKVILLEVNVSPDTTSSTPITGRLVRQATSDLFDVLFLEGAADGPRETMRSVQVAANTGRRWPSGGILGEGVASIVTPAAKKLDAVMDPLWELWYVGKEETQRDMKRISASKMESVGRLRLGKNSISEDLVRSFGEITNRVLDIVDGVDSIEFDDYDEI
mmetsp:Transcript_12320/g.18674  ORF Transcript_12320/g.18674 Transcript_12320/m.18674 type:complete len:544 (-) Transcript_12320:9-1640(-)